MKITTAIKITTTLIVIASISLAVIYYFLLEATWNAYKPHIQERNDIAESHRTIETPLTIEIPLEEVKEPPEPILEPLEPDNPQAYPSQERLEQIYDIMYSVSEELDFKDTQLLFDIAYHESTFRTHVRGDRGHSRGLFQINDIAHPEVSDEQADSVVFSTKWAIDIIQQGKQWQEWYKTMLKIENQL